MNPDKANLTRLFRGRLLRRKMEILDVFPRAESGQKMSAPFFVRVSSLPEVKS